MIKKKVSSPSVISKALRSITDDSVARADILYILLPIDENFVISVVNCMDPPTKTEFLSECLENARVSAVWKYYQKNVEALPKFPILSKKYRGKLDDLFEILDYCLCEEYTTLTSLYKMMKSCLVRTTFSINMFTILCEKYKIGVSDKKIDRILRDNENSSSLNLLFDTGTLRIADN